MNLRLVHNLLTAADEQPDGFLKVRGANLAHEVELMALAGLVDASPVGSVPEITIVINRVTDAGSHLPSGVQGSAIASLSTSQPG